MAWVPPAADGPPEAPKASKEGFNWLKKDWLE